MKCIVQNCYNKPSKKLLYFKFPNDKAYKWLWLKAIGAPPNYVATRKDHVCSKHFKPSDFLRISRRRKILKDSAVPSVNLSRSKDNCVNKMSDEVIEIRGEDGDSDCEIIPEPEVSVVEVEDSQDENSENEENSSNAEEEDSEDSETSEEGIKKEIKHEGENVSQECVRNQERMNQENQIEMKIRHNSEGSIQEIQSSQESIQEIQTTQEESIQEIQTTQEESIQEIHTTQETQGTQEEQLTWELQTTQEEELTQKTRGTQQEQLIPEIQDTQESQQTAEIQRTQESTIDSVNNHAILLRMCFSNENNFFNLKDCVMKALSSCLKQKGINIDFIENGNIYDICVYEKPISTNEVQQEQNYELEEIVDSSDDLCFQIDTTPQQNLDKKAIPCYKRSRKEVLNENNKKQKIDPDACKRPMTSSCFNCLGNHSLKDCPQPRNQQKINRNRKAYANKCERYHVEGRQKYAHLKPGQISDSLKKALGLRNGEIPSFYYKMRLLGYPPGWLEEAKIPHSGLTLFDSEGRRVLESDEEDGEVDVVRYKYDVEKIISFPGYNVYPGSDYFDDYRYHGVPPMLSKFSKEEFIKSLGDENIQRGYKRKKLKDLSANTSVSETVTIQDMEVEDIENNMPQIFNQPPPPPIPPPLPPPLPEDPEPSISIPPPPPPTEEENSQNIIKIEDKEEGELEEYSRDSLSLAELEEKQKQLLEALNNSSIILDSSIDEQQQQQKQKQSINIEAEETVTTTTTIEDNNQESIELSQMKSLTTNSNENLSQENQRNSEYSNLNNSQTNSMSQNDIINCSDSPSTSKSLFSESNTPNSIQTSQSTTTTSTISTIQRSNTKQLLGTPILKFSPYDKLPSGDKFSVGVSDVINFENLSDSTGKYEQMKKVLQKIRRTQLNMNE